MRRRRLLAGALCVFALAFALRLLPLYWSPLPFNPDGIGYAANTRDVLSLGSWQFAELATDQLGYTALLAVLSALLGDRPLVVAQPVSAAVGAASVLAAVVLANRLLAVSGASRATARTGGLFAGLLLATEGIYLFRSVPTDEQTAGLLLVPAAGLAFARWVRSRRAAWAALTCLLVAPIAPLHNLTGLVTAVVLTLVCVLAVCRARTLRAAGGFGLLAIGAWSYVLGYHALVSRVTGAVIVQSDRLLRVPGLFVAWLVLVAFGVAWYVTSSKRFQRGTVLAAVLSLFALVAVNALRPVYPATRTTPRGLLVALLPLVVPVAFAGLAAHYAGRDRPASTLTVALAAGPFVFVGTGLTAQLTFPYIGMAYRAQLFMHAAVLALAGIGTVTFARRCPRRLQAVVVALVLLCALVSTPVAYAGLELLTYQGVTTEAEFDAAAFASTELDGWATDDHLSRVAGYHGGGGGKGSVYRWLRQDRGPPSCPTLAQRSWTTTGAQFHPQAPAVLSVDAYRQWHARNDVVYVSTATDRLTVVRPRGNASRSC